MKKSLRSQYLFLSIVVLAIVLFAMKQKRSFVHNPSEAKMEASEPTELKSDSEAPKKDQ